MISITTLSHKHTHAIQHGIHQFSAVNRKLITLKGPIPAVHKCVCACVQAETFVAWSCNHNSTVLRTTCCLLIIHNNFTLMLDLLVQNLCANTSYTVYHKFIKWAFKKIEGLAFFVASVSMRNKVHFKVQLDRKQKNYEETNHLENTE